MKVRILFIALVAFFCSLLPLSAEYNKLGIPDSTEIRAGLVRTWFTAPLEQVRMNGKQLYLNDIGTRFQVRMEETKDTFAIIVAPSLVRPLDKYTETGVEKITEETFPGDACGSWVLLRDIKTGKPQCVRLFFGQSSEMFIQFSPANNNTIRADFIIGNSYAARGVPIGISFNQLYTASVAKILSFTANTLPWRYADIHPGLYHDNMQMIGVIRKNLERIMYTEDAAYDELGKPVRISTGKPRTVTAVELRENKLSLSSAGFIKWIIDGLVEPLSGSYTYLEPLKKQTVELNPLSHAGIVNAGRTSQAGEKTQPIAVSFSLNWTRNLAAARLSAHAKKTYMYNESGMDVKVEPFSGELAEDGTVHQSIGYIENCGYQIARLRSLLYVLAVSDPSYCYLAAVRQSFQNGNDPELYMFNEAAILFPYFDAKGTFNCVVFENGKELSLSQFVSRYDNCFVHLTRVLTSRDFFPQ